MKDVPLKALKRKSIPKMAIEDLAIQQRLIFLAKVFLDMLQFIHLSITQVVMLFIFQV